MRALIVVCAAGLACPALAQGISQPNTDLCERSFVSDAVSGQFNNRRQADDFRLTNSTPISSIRWWGGAANFGGIFDLANVDAFRVVIYEDNGGVPNDLAAPLFDQEFPKASVNPRETGFRIFAPNTQGTVNEIQFEQTATLASPLSLPTGTRFWITIGARLSDPSGAAWRWSSSLQGDFVTAQQNPFGGGSWQVFDPSGANYAFEFNPGPDGAICLPDGGCVIGTAEQAFAAGGIYQGDGSDCGTVVCDPFAVWTQAPNQPCNNSFPSNAIAGQFGEQLQANNFELAGDAVIDGVRWWGGSQNFQDFDLFNFESWTITIYGSDSAGAPDESNIIHAETFLKADTNAVLTDYRNRQDADLFEQSVQFSTPVQVSAGQRYWISIGTTNFDPNGDTYRWAGSIGGDRVTASKNWTTGVFSVFSNTSIEYAFQLLGSGDSSGSCLGDIADDFGFTADEGGGPDGVVDFGDFVALLGLIGPCSGGPGCLGDIADDFGFTADEGGGPDGVVDFGDFVALLGLIGPCP